jgi:membrane associated rhomboid family serine protease
MSSAEFPAEAAGASLPDDLVEAGVYCTAAEGFEHGLVVLALGEAYWLMASEGGYRLLVEAAVAEAVRDQLARFDRESTGWPPPPIEAPGRGRKGGMGTPLLWAWVVIGSFWAQAKWPGWSEAGALDAAAVFGRGDVWRAATALFLHSDVGHLVSNLGSGVLVFTAAIMTFGRRRGWLLLGVAAGAGNFLAAAMHAGTAYRSLGASTAVFAGLGLLTGRAIRVVARREQPHRWRTMIMPFAAGATVLGLFGAGDVHIDVLAHATGFGAGCVLGLAVAADD